MSTRVLVVLGRSVCREGLCRVLSEWDFDVVFETGDGREAVEAISALSPDVAIIESTLPGLNGVDTIRAIVAASPRVAVIAMSEHADWEIVTGAMQAGAKAFVLAAGGLTDLRRAFDAVSTGQAYMSVVAESVLLTSIARVGTSAVSRLTSRERDVLQLLAEGLQTKEAADRLHISAKTIETHRRQLMRKLDIYTVAGLTKFAIRCRITTLGFAVAVAVGSQ